MKIGIIGSGQIGGTLARRFREAGHAVEIANSRGPASLSELAAETGAKPVSVHEAARGKDFVIVTIPMKNVPHLPKDLFAGVDPETVIIDTCNYYPRHRDGRIEAIENGMTEGRWVSNQLGRPTVKAFNNINWTKLLSHGKPKGDPARIAIPVAGDDAAAKTKVIALIDDIGFDGLDAGGLDDSYRQQPKAPCYGADLPKDGLVKALAEATPERHEEFIGRPQDPMPRA